MLKKRTVEHVYSNFVHELKISNHGKWYLMAKRLGAKQNNTDAKLHVE